MKTASFYQSTADAIGVLLYVYADGSGAIAEFWWRPAGQAAAWA